MENKSGWRCPECDYQNSASAKTCGGCGRSHDDSNKLAYARLHTDDNEQQQKDKSALKTLGIVGLFALMLVGASLIGGGGNSKSNTPATTEARTTRVTYHDYSNDITPYTVTERKTESYSPAYDNGTADQRAALERAYSYLKTSAFSQNGLTEQLEYEGYSHDVAAYAAQYCGADWNEQAILKAKSYIRTSGFSYEGLKEQLEYEGFTSSEALYGADNCGADWNDMAVKKAKSYMRIGDYSESELIDQLEFEGFTYSQASYGASHASD